LLCASIKECVFLALLLLRRLAFLRASHIFAIGKKFCFNFRKKSENSRKNLWFDFKCGTLWDPDIKIPSILPYGWGKIDQRITIPFWANCRKKQFLTRPRNRPILKRMYRSFLKSTIFDVDRFGRPRNRPLDGQFDFRDSLQNAIEYRHSSMSETLKVVRGATNQKEVLQPFREVLFK